MAQNHLLATGLIGFVVSMLGCVTPALVAVLAILGVSGGMGWLDYILLPAIALFAALAVYATCADFAAVRFQTETQPDPCHVRCSVVAAKPIITGP